MLELDPNANWTLCYNELLKAGPDAVDYLLSRPEMNRRCAPDDLHVMLATSLLRLLGNPQQAPKLSVSCYETTLGLLFFDLRVLGRSVGEIRIPEYGVPVAWHDLYPARFNHLLAGAIDAERDRCLMVLWWKTQRGDTAAYRDPRPLDPRADQLWPLFSRRYADVWTYEVKPSVFLCQQAPAPPVLLRERTSDYNLVRAACIWLGTSKDPDVQDRLIELVAHPSDMVSYNARFALRFNSDARIRDAIERYNHAEQKPTPERFHTRSNVTPDHAVVRSEGISCRQSRPEQRSAVREMDQIYDFLHLDRRSGGLYGNPFRRVGSPSARS